MPSWPSCSKRANKRCTVRSDTGKRATMSCGWASCCQRRKNLFAKGHRKGVWHEDLQKKVAVKQRVTDRIPQKRSAYAATKQETRETACPDTCDKLGVRISTTNLVSGFRRQTRCPDFDDKLGVRISATNSMSGNKPSGTVGRVPLGSRDLPACA